jgi:rhamnulokinase
VSGRSFAAVDLGASSGRVIVGRVSPNELAIEEVHRFPNDPVTLPDGLHWDVDGLYRSVVEGLRRAGAASRGDLAGLAIDSWGVDYGLLDEDGALVDVPFHYRDGRTDDVPAAVDGLVPRDRLYARTGTQFLSINTLYQLTADATAGRLAKARSMAMIPDLLGSWLTGVVEAEETNASTTGLYDPAGRAWDDELIVELGLPRAIFGPMARPGSTLGPIRQAVAESTGLPPGTLVRHVGSHDTASAVVGVPADGGEFAYVACGTWGLVGVEIDAPIRTPESRLANFTNEAGVDGRIRYLRNVMGLWLLQESMRSWAAAGDPPDLEDLLEAAAALPEGGPRIEPNDPVFLAPGDMPARIADACRRADVLPPAERPALVRCILDSLAAAFARGVDDAERLSGQTVRVVHLVGGGARNRLLCKLTAQACGRPVIAGPVEATAVGNLLVQARAHGSITGDLDALRALIRTTGDTVRYEPAAVRR